MKDTKPEARYVSESRRRGERCDVCTMWRPPAGCTAVEGTIAPGGWCKYFEARKRKSDPVRAMATAMRGR